MSNLTIINPSTIDSCTLPPRPITPAGTCASVDLCRINFRCTQSDLHWSDKRFDGLRALLQKFPPPIALPTTGDVLVEAPQIKPTGADHQIEGTKWTLRWIDQRAKIVDGDTHLPAICSFKVYHKYDKLRDDANWRVDVAVRLASEARPSKELNERIRNSQPCELRIPIGTENAPSWTVKEVLIRDPGDRSAKTHKLSKDPSKLSASQFTDDLPPYTVVYPEELNWINDAAFSYARTRRTNSILDGTHFTTQPTYIFTTQSFSGTFGAWVGEQVAFCRIVGIPRFSVEGKFDPGVTKIPDPTHIELIDRRSKLALFRWDTVANPQQPQAES